MRLKYLDNAKALGILLVILGHCTWLNAIPGLARVIYSFHMPLFFVISGILIKPLALKEAVKKYSQSYLYPYCVVCCLGLLFVVALSFIIKPVYDNFYIQWLCRSFYATGASQGLYTSFIPKIGAIWFLWALFWACLIYSNIIYRKVKWIDKIVIISLSMSIAIFTKYYINLPLSFQSGLFALLYVWIGNTIREYDVLCLFEKHINKNRMFIFSILTLWGISIIAGKLDVGMCKPGYGPINILSSIFICVTILYFYKRHTWNVPLIDYLGTHTLHILCGHFTIHYVFYNFGWPARFLQFYPIVNLIIEYCIELVGAILLGVLFDKFNLLSYKVYKVCK